MTQIWRGLDPQLIRNSFIQCGIIADESQQLNSALKQLVETNNLPNVYVDEMVDEWDRDEYDQISGLYTFITIY